MSVLKIAKDDKDDDILNAVFEAFLYDERCKYIR